MGVGLAPVREHELAALHAMLLALAETGRQRSAGMFDSPPARAGGPRCAVVGTRLARRRAGI